ncbi:MAG: TonB-dependent receptor, partial [Bacteroidales bacterium]|nr:TonB-dependent receptor [Bacteroidales bacterium]
MKKVFIFVLILLFFVNQGYSQRPNQEKMNGKQRPKIGVLTGKIVDEITGLPVEFGTIALFDFRENKLLTGGTSNQKGKFHITEIPVGKYRVRISFIGYETFNIEDPIMLTRTEPEQFLGTIKLKPSSTSLEGVNIVAERELMENSLDKKTYNVSKDITAAGSDATEIMNRLPSVDVDMDGNISLRGNENVTILIDGKPSALTSGDAASFLQQLPASSIENVEVITNPSAKYDPEGIVGIININLKKDKLQGTNGTVNLTAGTWDKYNLSASLNHFTGKFNVFANYSYRDHNRESDGSINQASFLKGKLLNSSENLDFRNRARISNMFKGGFDYYIDKTSNLTFTGVYSAGISNSADSTFRIERDYLDAVTADSLIKNSSNGERSTQEITLDYRKKFLRPNQELTASIRYSDHTDNDNDYYGTNRYDITEGTSSKTGLQADYVHPFGDTYKFEVGYRSDINRSKDVLIYHTLSEDGHFTEDPVLSNAFNYDLDIHSVYALFSGIALGNLDYQLGLRAEQVYTHAELVSENDDFINNYFNLYPSMHFSYKLQNNNEFMLSYSRRVNRPRSHSLNPFRNESMPGNIRYGNPFLKPEYINSYELGYSKQWEKTTLTSAVYYKKIHDLMSRVSMLVDPVNYIMEHTMTNLGTGENYGFEFTASSSITKWWRLNANLNLFQQKIEGTNLDGSDVSVNGS